jgi:hypothetical protein
VELAHAKPSAAMFEAIRVRMNGLGLTPKGKRDLRWRVAELVDLPARRARRRRHLEAT